ncbi:putative 40S ribosomal protein S10 [Gregarina niphandrodes]|uniref:40S ribosomal protein S10 n=1 Tax=Gregarina niphandrodes TaxID=110365 RepID=A0A023B3V8_GRENI|nr:putative 40S ribosomal protein S10 [Gregarina niphandrodes]EZG56008.1 putative 40S ribosomal protein S10 [Gregarina niphandrodes]|eukprot:XP_011131376.1 putative 40S ribosomal protein S10 [Gregarina niphandrodes]
MPPNVINSLISKQTRKALLDYLMKEGTIVVKKDYKLPQHEETGLQNLHVMMMMRSLTSRNYVTEVYNWRYLYYVLTPEGIEYIRQELQLPAGPMPATYAVKVRAPRTDRDRPPRRNFERRGEFDRREPRGDFERRGEFDRREPRGERPVESQAA